MIRILFVCYANICRSPMAEFVLKNLLMERKLTGVEVSSAAISKVRENEPVFEKVREQLLINGLGNNPKLSYEENQFLLQNLEEKRSRKFTRKDYRENDLILIMEQSNRKPLHFEIGDDVHGKIHRLLEYSDDVRDIEDPWKTGDFETAYRDIESGCLGVLSYLTKDV